MGPKRAGVSNAHPQRVPSPGHLPASLGFTPYLQHERQQQACEQTVRRCQAACALPAHPASDETRVAGGSPRVRCFTRRALPPPAYKSATSLRLASVSPSM
jgi:hypothetical protein